MKKQTPNKRSALISKLKKVKMLLMDVDGVLTEGGIILGIDKQEFKIYDVQDGMGITLARLGGLKVGFLTGRASEVVDRRAEELHVDICYQGASNKLEALRDILDRYDLPGQAVCYIGDDVLDVCVLKHVGTAVTVANGRPEVKRIADYVTTHSGGKGAVRETVELILKAQNKWKSVLERVYGPAAL
jgi:3-deoxy-D-manno-octulosonate 8-phosphate phosphatase (KDO 8-P phosphatase)